MVPQLQLLGLACLLPLLEASAGKVTVTRCPLPARCCSAAQTLERMRLRLLSLPTALLGLHLPRLLLLLLMLAPAPPRA